MLSGLLYRLQKAALALQLGRNPARVNAHYNALSDAQKIRFYESYCKLFHSALVKKLRVRVAGTWSVQFGAATVYIPLRAQHIALDWDSALSLIGHDYPVKKYYLEALRGPDKPELFIDIGANFGVHSLLMAANGCTTISFEPNPACAATLEAYFAANALKPDLRAVALSARPGTLPLLVPEDESWLGALDTVASDFVRGKPRLQTLEVPVTTLDSVQATATRILVKMDVEGAELDVLRGGRGFLSQKKPEIIFESLPGSDRRGLFWEFSTLGYELFDLRPDGAHALPGSEPFCACPSENFLARPSRASNQSAQAS